MKRRHKFYIKINLMSIFFIVVSFISVTLAWFAYSGLSSVNTEVGVKAWYLTLDKNGTPISNEINITQVNIYPGMETINEEVNINNEGDSDAQVSYSIVSARILDTDNYVVGELVDGVEMTSEELEDKLSHFYPFHVNISISKNFIPSKGGTGKFAVSISWPLDSNTDVDDTEWGTAAYSFQDLESKKQNPRPAIQIVLKVSAEQYITSDDAQDPRYNLGDVVRYDPVNNNMCDINNTSCLKTYVIENKNTVGSNTVLLLPDLLGNYASGTFSEYGTKLSEFKTGGGWTANTLNLSVKNLLDVISNDVSGSFLVRNTLSDSIIGNLRKPSTYTSELAKSTFRPDLYNGYYRFLNDNFGYLTSLNCVWTEDEYSENKGFASKLIDIHNSMVYGEDKQLPCKIVPVIVGIKPAPEIIPAH